NTYGYDLAMPSGSDLLQGIDVFEKNMRICRSYLLCSNIKKNGRYLYKPRRKITSASGKKIGFIGISPVEDLPEGYSVLEGDELDKALQDDISALRQGGVDAIFLIGEGSERVQVVDDTIVEYAKTEANSTTEKNTTENDTIVKETSVSSDNVIIEDKAKSAITTDSEDYSVSDNEKIDKTKSDTMTVSEDNSVSENNKKTTASLYEVMKGDSLWKISYKIYGKQLKNRWEEIFNLNKNKIANQEIIYSGQEFELP
ncbi:MAG: LysM peptidoglycan-binding domain-containing protein, partial [Lachnospiraceae bacterium]|nr:LysM peptidoglycan-binding domain-containing protein [Lachnospiraceae bacterium]